MTILIVWILAVSLQIYSMPIKNFAIVKTSEKVSLIGNKRTIFVDISAAAFYRGI